MASFFIVLIILAVYGVAKAKDTFTPRTRSLTKEDLEEDTKYMLGTQRQRTENTLKINIIKMKGVKHNETICN